MEKYVIKTVGLDEARAFVRLEQETFRETSSRYEFGYLVRVIDDDGKLITQVLQPFQEHTGYSLKLSSDGTDLEINNDDDYDYEEFDDDILIDQAWLGISFKSYDRFILDKIKKQFHSNNNAVCDGDGSALTRFEMERITTFGEYYGEVEYPEDFLIDYAIARYFDPIAMDDKVRKSFEYHIFSNFQRLLEGLKNLGMIEMINQYPEKFISPSTIDPLLEWALREKYSNLVAFLVETKHQMQESDGVKFDLDLDNTSNEWGYTINEYGEGVLRGFKGNTTEKMVLPAAINGIKMKRIGENFVFTSFEPAWQRVTELVIPDGYTEIEEKAFYKAHSLESVQIASSVERIGNEAFLECFRLEKVEGGQGLVSIGDRAFWLSSLENFTIGDKLSQIGENVFPELGVPCISLDGWRPFHSKTEITVSQTNPFFEIVEETLYDRRSKEVVHFPIGAEQAPSVYYEYSNTREFNKLEGIPHSAPKEIPNRQSRDVLDYINDDETEINYQSHACHFE